MATEPLVNHTCDTRARSFAFIVFIVSIWSDLLVFVDDLCQILGMFST